MCSKLYANTVLFCIRDLSILGFWIHGGPGSNSLWILRDDCIYHTSCVHLSVDIGVAFICWNCG